MMPSPAVAQSPQAIHDSVLARIATESENCLPLVALKPGNPFRFFNITEMMVDPPPPDWIIHGYLEGDTLAVLFGESGSMKSFVALDMALCVATGRAWHGHSIPMPGPVFYIAAEGGQGLAKRMKAWTVAQQMEPLAPLFILPRPVQFLDPTDVEQVAEAIAALVQEHGAPRLLIIDTLARCFGGDENGSKDMNAFVAALDRLRVRFRCTMLVIHHSGLNDKNRARGSSVLRAALDWEYRLTRNGNSCKLVCSKSKDYDEPQALLFKSEVISTGWVNPGTKEPITSVVLRRVAAEETPVRTENSSQPLKGANVIALRALMNLSSSVKRVHMKDWRNEAHRLGISSSEKLRAKNMAFIRAISVLVETGYVGVSGNHYWLVDEQKEHEEQSGNMFLLFSGERKEQREHPSLEGVPMCPPQQDVGQSLEGGAE